MAIQTTISFTAGTLQETITLLGKIRGGFGEEVDGALDSALVPIPTAQRALKAKVVEVDEKETAVVPERRGPGRPPGSTKKAVAPTHEEDEDDEEEEEVPVRAAAAAPAKKKKAPVVEDDTEDRLIEAFQRYNKVFGPKKTKGIFTELGVKSFLLEDIPEEKLPQAFKLLSAAEGK